MTLCAPVQLLIVEDNNLDAERVLRTFKRLNIPYSFERAKDGIDALDTLRGTGGRAPLAGQRIVLLDLNMPRMNGLEFLQEVRNDPELSDTPVFVFTTSDRPQDISDAHRLNVAGYIVKPMRSEEMTEAFDTLHRFWELSKYPPAQIL